MQAMHGGAAHRVFGSRLPQKGDAENAGQDPPLRVIDPETTGTLAGLIGKSRSWYMRGCAHGKCVSSGCTTLEQALSHARAITDGHNIRNVTTDYSIWTCHRKEMIATKRIWTPDAGFV